MRNLLSLTIKPVWACARETKAHSRANSEEGDDGDEDDGEEEEEDDDEDDEEKEEEDDDNFSRSMSSDSTPFLCDIFSRTL